MSSLQKSRAYQSICSRYLQSFYVNDEGWKSSPVLHLEDNGDDTYTVSTTGSAIRRSSRTRTLGQPVETYTIDKSSYRSPVIKDYFEPDTHIKTDKMNANAVVLMWLKKLMKLKDHVVILDSPQGFTSCLLNIMGLPRHQIHVPNPQEQTDETALERSCWYEATFFEFMRDYMAGDKSRCHFWLDYCCTFKGSPGNTLPKLDIEMLLLKGNLPKQNGLLAMTFSTRCFKNSAVYADVHKFLKSKGKMYHYRFEEVVCMEYGTVMLLCFKTVS